MGENHIKLTAEVLPLNLWSSLEVLEEKKWKEMIQLESCASFKIENLLV